MSSSLGGFTGMRDNTGSINRGSSTGNIIPKGYTRGQIQNFDPQQMQLYQQQFGHAGPDSYLSRLAGGDESIFNQIEAPAMRQFNQQQGQIASRFSNMGQGGRNSSAFQNTINQSSSDFAQDLQSRRQELQRQALMDLMGISNTLLGQRPNENFLIEKKQKGPSFLQSLIGGVAPITGAGLGFLAGGPAGAMAGGQIGSSFGQAFSGGF